MSASNADLLRQLSLDRSAPPPRPRRLLPYAVTAAMLLAAVAAVALWPRALPVKAVIAEAEQGAAGAPVATSQLDASGYVVARRQATVSAKITGKVAEVTFEEGQQVKAGEVLARLDDSNAAATEALSAAQLEAARAQLTELEVSLTNARRDAQRNRDLLAKNLVSQAALDNADTAVAQLEARLASQKRGVVSAEKGLAVAQQQRDDTVVRAPFSGVVTVKNAQPGEMISPLSAGGAGTRTGLGTLVDMNSLEIEVDVSENFITKVTAGAPARAKLNAYPDWEIPAHVIAIIPTADRSKATVRVRVGIDRAEGEALDARILPEMGVRVSFLATAPPTAGAVSKALVRLPAEAVQTEGVTGTAYVLNHGHAERRGLTLANAGNDGMLRIAQGISAGETVLIGDFAKLKDGMAVRIEQ